MDSLKGTLTPMKVLQGRLNGGIAYGTFNYNELDNKPSINGILLQGNVVIFIPVKTSDLTNDSGFITSADIPTKLSELINDAGFITITDVPTKLSELLNDAGFITLNDIPAIPTKTSELNNDSGFLTMNTTPVRSVNSQTGDVNLFIPNATSQLNNDANFVRLQDLSADNIPYDSENSIAEKIEENTQAIGNLSDLDTTDKSSLVGAVNEVTKITAGTFTADANINLLRSTLVKVNSIKFLSIVFTVRSSSREIGTLPSGFDAIYNYDFTIANDTGKATRARIYQNNNLSFSTDPEQGSYYALTIAYL